jgi:ATP-binding cassette subfamily B protein
MKNLINLFELLSYKRKKQLVFFLLLTILAAGCEIASLAILLPFLAILIKPEAINSYNFLNELVKFLSLDSNNILLLMTCSFGGAAVLIGFVRLLLLWWGNKIAFGIGADICLKIYRKALYSNYLVHLNTNSSKIISSITERSNVVIYNVVLPSLTLVSSAIIFTSIIFTLLVIGKEIIFFGIIFFAIIYLAIIKSIKLFLIKYGKIVNFGAEKQIKMLQEGLGGIRDVLLDGTQEVHISLFKKNDSAVRGATARIQFISQSPKYAIEALGLLMIAVFSYIFAADKSNISTVVPILGIIALGSQRLLPVMQQAYASWAAITSGSDSLDTTIQLLYDKNEIIKNSNDIINFQEEIVLRNISFKYPGKETNVLNSINMKISCGEKIGIIGKTGGGKSTLLDLIMCLIYPDDGFICVDNIPITANNSHEFKKNISHVPQKIFLADATIAENIALGEKNIDTFKLRESVNLAELSELIGRLPNGLNEKVGENGHLLSGGERQRLGIARALYKNASIIILDEATSALDEETEKKVIDNIEKHNGKKTILMVAHRTSTLKNCDTIYEIVAGNLEKLKLDGK